jgi:hypothetical protein
MSGIYLWSLDAPPIPNDYTIADLRSAPPDCAESYELLLTLADQNQPPEDSNTAPLSDDAPAIGLSASDILLVAETRDLIKKTDYAKITRYVTAHANDITQAWENAKKGRIIINKLNEFPEIADLTEPSLGAEAGFLPNLSRLCDLYRAYVCLQCEKGNGQEAVRQLIELDSVYRKLSVNARSLVARLVCFAGLRMNLCTANFLANNPKISKQSLDLLAEHFLPLSQQQLSLRNAFVSGYLMFRNTLDAELKKVTDRSTPMLKMNSTLCVYRNFCNATLEYAQEAGKDEGQRYSVWPAIYPDFMPEVGFADGLIPWKCWQYKYYNPMGSLYLSILVPGPDLSVPLKSKTKVRDDLFQIVLNKRLGNEISLKARAYGDEYIIDVEGKKIFSPGRDGEPNTTDDIKFTINPQVLGF